MPTYLAKGPVAIGWVTTSKPFIKGYWCDLQIGLFVATFVSSFLSWTHLGQSCNITLYPRAFEKKCWFPYQITRPGAFFGSTKTTWSSPRKPATVFEAQEPQNWVRDVLAWFRRFNIHGNLRYPPLRNKPLSFGLIKGNQWLVGGGGYLKFPWNDTPL